MLNSPNTENFQNVNLFNAVISRHVTEIFSVKKIYEFNKAKNYIKPFGLVYFPMKTLLRLKCGKSERVARLPLQVNLLNVYSIAEFYKNV